MSQPLATFVGDLSSPFRAEDDLSFRSFSSAFQHHVGLSRIGQREDYTYACLKFTTVKKFSNSAQPLGRHFHKKENCSDAVVPCALLIRFGYGGDQFAPRAKNLKRASLRTSSSTTLADQFGVAAGAGMDIVGNGGGGRAR